MTKQAEDVLIDRQKVFTLVKQWRKIDVDITEAANEAKDNVKYLATLERFLEPLASGDLNQILDILPGLMNAVKMVHTIARYFNTTARMTKLFMKITNQLIESCKDAINGQEAPEKIWDQDPGPLLELLEQTLRLNERYQELYQSTKDRLLAMPKGKQFDFSEAQIFGRFDLFSRRAIKLIDLFSTIQQFKKLQEVRHEQLRFEFRAFVVCRVEIKSLEERQRRAFSNLRLTQGIYSSCFFDAWMCPWNFLRPLRDRPASKVWSRCSMDSRRPSWCFESRDTTCSTTTAIDSTETSSTSTSRWATSKSS